VNPQAIRPFAYPVTPHARQHGPVGYSRYQDYRPWLRDEFSFRCVYCLWREEWLDEEQTIDHFLPKALYPRLERKYDNLVYACRWCNRRKRISIVPGPSEVAYAECLHVTETGEIKALNGTGVALVRLLGLDTKNQNKRRAKILRTLRTALRLAQDHPNDPDAEATLRDYFGYPENLPDLLDIQPAPKTNSRPDGVRNSHRARKDRDELPDYY
jgi:hypothetical protein